MMQNKMMKNKTTKPSTKPKKATRTRDVTSKESPWLEDYMDCFHFKVKPVTEMFLERISQELIMWAEKETKQYKIAPFFDEKRIAYDTYTRWAKKYPQFGAAYQLAKSILGTRREYGALERKLDAGTVINMMPHYDPEWKEMTKFRTDLKAQANENANTGTQFVVMEKFTLPDKKESQAQESTDEPREAVSRPTPEEVAARKSDMGIERRRLSDTSVVDS